MPAIWSWYQLYQQPTGLPGWANEPKYYGWVYTRPPERELFVGLLVDGCMWKKQLAVIRSDNSDFYCAAFAPNCYADEPAWRTTGKLIECRSKVGPAATEPEFWKLQASQPSGNGFRLTHLGWLWASIVEVENLMHLHLYRCGEGTIRLVSQAGTLTWNCGGQPSV